MPTCRPSLPILLWVVVCAWLNVAGWLLSAIGRLDRTGYAVALAGLATVVWRLALRHGSIKLPRRRFTRALPAAWLLLAAMVLLGALLYPPNNLDSLWYRVPRVLHWLAAGRWHWIPSNSEILNTRATGFEFVFAPLALFFRTDRWCVLINFIGFLLLPGLVFSIFKGLGLAGRAAWRWMWVVPTGYCYILQCGGMGNDAYGAVCGLAMMYFALRAYHHRRWSDATLALVAAALTTGAKSGNLPLLLPAALALIPSARVLLRRPMATAAALAFACMASLVPISVLNWKYAGTWFGSPQDYAVSTGGPPHVALAGNTLLLATQNLAPPVVPITRPIHTLLARCIPAGLRENFARYFDMPNGTPTVPEMQMEESAGLGFGVCILFLVTLAAAARWRTGRHSPRDDRFLVAIRWSAWVSFGVVLLKNFIVAVPRLLAPYYPLLLPGPLAALPTSSVTARRWWTALALINAGLAAILLVVNPSRPLFPALTLCSFLQERYPASPAVQRITTVYSTYRKRPDVLAPLRELLPASEKVVGFVGSGEPETSLWRPFGSRWVKQVLPSDTAQTVRAQKIQTIVLSARDPDTVFGLPLDQWLMRMNGTITATRRIQVFAGKPAWDWHIVRLAEPAEAASPEAPR